MIYTLNFSCDVFKVVGKFKVKTLFEYENHKDILISVKCAMVFLKYTISNSDNKTSIRNHPFVLLQPTTVVVVR